MFAANDIRAEVFFDGKATFAVVSGFCYHYERLCFDFRTCLFQSAASGRTTRDVTIKVASGCYFLYSTNFK